ncbi:Ig-like domain-containing protein [Clostridium sp. PL3]|uniref:Ig-like domain-containing protein n=1 Tax=Clostridium thailandense TaxID=2794346 RepID=A0A949TW80_9CLOT|nr:Ig-like domain-containing protein [Clostridium thailandense]MBV7276477.1 Ig-like domain-containing protein [Clostridium thailandense]
MKKRNLKLIVLTITIATFLSSNITVFAKSNQLGKNEVTSNQKESTSQKGNSGQKNEKSKKEILIISHRLDSIEISLKGILKKLNAYTNGTATTDQGSDGTQTSTDITSSDGTQTGTDITSSDGIQTSTDTTSSDGTQTGTDTQISTTTETTADASTSGEIAENPDTTNTTLNGDTEDLSDDFENEYNEEDAGVYNSFYGKLNAVNNRLNTVEGQISRINSSDSADLTQLNDRISKLREQVKAAMDTLINTQNQNVKKIEEQSNKKKMEDQKISLDKKTWKIHFTKALNEDTVNSKNIMIVDSSNNVVDVDISYDKANQNVVIQANDSFKKGETYTILIGDGVQSVDGKNLSRPVVKSFIVN